MNTRIPRISAINYFGGKSRHLDWLLPLVDRESLVELSDCNHWVEPFTGSAVVTMNQKPWPIETINDLDSGVINFFHVLRTNREALVDSLLLTPYSRAEFQQSLKPTRNKLENARRFFIRMQQSFGGMGYSQTRLSSWRTQYAETRRGMSMEVSKWLTKVNGLDEAAARLSLTQIENRDFRYVMTAYNHRNVMMYCDPPYVHTSRTGKREYKFEMKDADHVEFLELANKHVGKIAVSGFDNQIYNEMLPLVDTGGKWFRSVCDERVVNIGKKRSGKIREVLWTNYNPNNTYLLLFPNTGGENS